MTLRRVSCLAALLLCACSSSKLDLGFAVALTLRFDDAVSASKLGSIDRLDLDVPEEGFTDEIVLHRAALRTERLVYRPNLGAASLTFRIHALAADGSAVAAGEKVVTLVPGATVAAEIVLDASALLPPDMDHADAATVDAAMPDGAVPVDLGMAPKELAFVSTPLRATAHTPVGIRAVDLNADGLVDVVVACSASAVQIFLAGAGHVLPDTPSKTLSSISSPSALGTGDFGGSAATDLVVADTNTSTLAFFVNDGSANFTRSSVSPATPSEPDSIVVADFDGDLRDDVAVASSTDARVFVYLSSATPAYANPAYFATSAPVQRLRSADLDADGFFDLLYTEPTTNVLGVRRSTGGVFTVKDEETYTQMPTIHDVAPFDLGKNGKPDLLMLGEGQPTGDAALLDNVKGMLSLDPSSPFFLAVGNNLHYAEVTAFLPGVTATLVTTRYPANSGSFSTNGSHRFDLESLTPTLNSQSQVGYVSQLAPDAFDLADLDGDGLLDVALVNRGSDTWAVGRQLAGSKLYAATAQPHYGRPPRSGDFSGDGRLDYLEADDQGTIYLFENQGNGNFQYSGTLAGIAYSVAVADLNGDGNADLVFGNHAGQLGTRLGSGPGTFADPVYSNATTVRLVDTQVGDFNKDGHLDVAMLAEVNDGDAANANVVWARGDGTGGFGTPSPLVAKGATAMLVVDLDGDGYDDLVTLSQSPPTLEWSRGSSFGLVSPTSFPSPVDDATTLAALDTDGDGLIDLVVGGSSIHVVRHSASAMFSDAGVVFSAAKTIALRAADLDGDGISELLAVNDDALVRAFGRKAGTFVEEGAWASGPFVGDVLVGNFTDDSLPDVLAFAVDAAFLKNASH